MPRLKIFRWRAIVPLALFGILVGVAWLLFLDVIVERGIERTGTVLVGARVDLESADVRLREGTVALRGLQVTNPDRPMTNLIQADEILVDLRMRPLLERKLLIDTVALRGMQFGTPRAESGAVDRPAGEAGLIRQEIDEWADAMRFPPLSLEGLGQALNVGAIQPESLQTLQRARAAAGFADSLGSMWDQRLRALDPQPRIDSTRAVIARLQEADPLRLGVTGVTSLANSARATLSSVQELRAGVNALDSTARSEIVRAQGLVHGLAEARTADYAWARGLVKLPSLQGPEVSPSIFGEAAVGLIRPVLYWIRQAEKYLPPGLDPRRYSGTRRARAPGTTVLFPKQDGLPRFLLEHGEASFRLEGTTAAAGEYMAQINGLTSNPTLYGRPLRVLAQRAGAAQGPRTLQLFGLLDHVSAPLHDSVDVSVDGLPLPTLDLAAVGARLTLGDGRTRLSLNRSGDSIAARWTWRSGGATWERLSTPQSDPSTSSTQIGSRAWADDLLWRAVSGIRDVEIDVRLSGAIRQPSLSVRSNVGDVVAQSLRRELGREIERAEAEVRARVDALVAGEMGRAEAALDSLRGRLTEQVAPLAEQLTQLETQLEQEIRNLTRRLPGGLRIP